MGPSNRTSIRPSQSRARFRSPTPVRFPGRYLREGDMHRVQFARRLPDHTGHANLLHGMFQDPHVLLRLGVNASLVISPNSARASALWLVCDVSVVGRLVKSKPDICQALDGGNSLVYVGKLAGSPRCRLLCSPDGWSVTDRMVSNGRGRSSARRGGPRPRARLASSSFRQGSSRPDRERKRPARDQVCER